MLQFFKADPGVGSLSVPFLGSLRLYPKSAVLGRKSVPEMYPTAR